MAAERKKLSLGAVSDRREDAASPADPTRAWKISRERADNLRDYARDMRRNPTPAQEALWDKLRDKKLCAFTFTRQVVMGSSIVDFACKTRWIVVEISEEGDDETLTALSDRKLTEVGVRVLRFPAAQVLHDIASVTGAIAEELQKPFERPKLAAQTGY